MRPSDQYVQITGTIIRETDAALLLKVNIHKNGENTSNEYWIPLSQCDRIDRNGSGEDVVSMSRWIAEKKDLI